jgi:hypothetical protein
MGVSDYLWDKSGADAEAARLEALLKPAAWTPGPPPAIRPAHARPFPLGTAAAAAAAFLVATLGLARVIVPAGGSASRPWKFSSAAREIDFGRFGSVTVHPDSSVAVVRQSDEEIRLRLHRGTIEARITLEARPRLFQVETPSTTCVDLGCHYTLTVARDGSSVVHVGSGRVAFTDGDREVFVPAGATCRAAPGRGSGTPHWDDAPAKLQLAVQAFDLATDRRAAALQVARSCERPEDGLTLWHLLTDRDPEVAALAYRVLENLVGKPEGVTREATLARDPDALEAWKNQVPGMGW